MSKVKLRKNGNVVANYVKKMCLVSFREMGWFVCWMGGTLKVLGIGKEERSGFWVLGFRF
jgi:hypothetical protein